MRCYLLTGGRSKRMGSPKAELLLGERTFLERVRDAAAEAFDEVVAVERAGGVEIAGMRTIFEAEHDGSGAIFGLERALDDCSDDRMWLTGVDYPLLTGALLRELRFRFESSSAALLVPMAAGHPQMLCAGYSRATLPLVRAQIASGDFRLRTLLKTGSAEVLDEGQWRNQHTGEPLLNVNDTATLELARRLHGGEADAHR